MGRLNQKRRSVASNRAGKSDGHPQREGKNNAEARPPVDLGIPAIVVNGIGDRLPTPSEQFKELAVSLANTDPSYAV